MAKLEDQTQNSINKNSGMQVSEPGPDHAVSFPSTGPVLDDNGNQITNDHSILTDVAGKHVWLHHQRHHHGNGRVHMSLSHAKDVGLADNNTDQQGAEALSPGSQQQAFIPQQPSDITQQGTDNNPTKPAAPSKLNNEVNEKDQKTK